MRAAILILCNWTRPPNVTKIGAAHLAGLGIAASWPVQAGWSEINLPISLPITISLIIYIFTINCNCRLIRTMHCQLKSGLKVSILIVINSVLIVINSLSLKLASESYLLMRNQLQFRQQVLSYKLILIQYYMINDYIYNSL